MEPKIIDLTEKKLIGMNLEMSLVQNKTGALWGSFVPRIKEIENRVSTDKISLQVYPELYYQNFKPINTFEKWAAVEVDNYDKIPNGMKPFVLKKGRYAVFFNKGSSADTSIYQYIFSEWIPNSIYRIDNRPHFEVLGEKYRNNNPNSEEEIWIPIAEK